MNKYIKSSTALRIVNEVYGKKDAYFRIQSLPAADVIEVKHGEPLTLEELRQMHGKPVWIEQENTWGIINVEEREPWKGTPFVTFYYKSVRCEYNIESRGLTCYSYEPVKHGRWIEKDDGVMHCTECDRVGNPHIDNYCPNCGANMKGGGDK